MILYLKDSESISTVGTGLFAKWASYRQIVPLVSITLGLKGGQGASVYRAWVKFGPRSRDIGKRGGANSWDWGLTIYSLQVQV
jgi:hypothetical protein